VKRDKTVIRGSQSCNVISLGSKHGGELQRIFVHFADGQCRNGARLLLRAALTVARALVSTGQEASPGRQAPGMAPFWLTRESMPVRIGGVAEPFLVADSDLEVNEIAAPLRKDARINTEMVKALPR
jgi:hypothetical protein